MSEPSLTVSEHAAREAIELYCYHRDSAFQSCSADTTALRLLGYTPGQIDQLYARWAAGWRRWWSDNRYSTGAPGPKTFFPGPFPFLEEKN